MSNYGDMKLGGDGSVSAKPVNRKIKTYCDGKCPMCSAIVDRVRHSARGEVFDLHDMHKEKSLPFKKAAIEKQMHVVDQDGMTYKGAKAIFKITEQYPRLQLATAIARLPPIRLLAPIVYQVVAANRRFIVGAASRIFWSKSPSLALFASGLPYRHIFGSVPAPIRRRRYSIFCRRSTTL